MLSNIVYNISELCHLQTKFLENNFKYSTHIFKSSNLVFTPTLARFETRFESKMARLGSIAKWNVGGKLPVNLSQMHTLFWNKLSPIFYFCEYETLKFVLLSDVTDNMSSW